MNILHVRLRPREVKKHFKLTLPQIFHTIGHFKGILGLRRERLKLELKVHILEALMKKLLKNREHKTQLKHQNQKHKFLMSHLLFVKLTK